MASTANANIINTPSITPSTTAITPVAATAGGDMVNHNNMRHHGGGSRVVSSSPWTQIVRGDSLDAIATPAGAIAAAPVSPTREAVSEQSVVVEEEGTDNGANAGKRPVWNKPSNGAVEVGAVMGAVSWPALSESARVSGKPSQQDLFTKGPSSDGSSSSVTVSQGSGSASSSTPKQVSHNANPNSTTPNHTMPARQRSMKRNGGANTSSSNGGASQPSGSQQTQTGEVHVNNPSPRDHASQRNSQNRSANDHPQQQQRNSFRRNGGPHVRDGSHHHNYGGRRDQDRQSQDWNNHRNYSGRDAHMQQQRVVPRFMRHPPPPPPPPTTSTPFIGAPAMRAFGSPIGFHASPVYYVPGPPPDPLRGVPFVAATMPPMYFPAPDPQLQQQIMTQIEYYFSNENLIRDIFLRQNMDDQGWVPIILIASFKKVLNLTDNIQLILESVRNSSILEVQVDKVRRQNDWMRWVMPPSAQFTSVSGPPFLGRSSQDMLAAHVQSISLEESVTSHSSARSQVDVHNEAFLGRSSSGDFNSQSQLLSLEGTDQVSVQGGSDSSTSMRNPSK
ncbi:la-related protein 1C isoform X2 [Ricinus communis]|uniref:la-related protein 1C isoform X2 n=1 Tax=Ricinus communis TaxID=3988 RepID=UPI00201A8758|nr:la-related protein 1C isoform X2 [Ricinus communis]